jgi:hypothetical protein
MFDDPNADWQAQINARLAKDLAPTRRIRGLLVRVMNTREEISTEGVFKRLDTILGLIERHQPERLRDIERYFQELCVKRHPCRGAFIPDGGICLLELTFVGRPGYSDPEIAACLIHEVTHARLIRTGQAIGGAADERECRRAELEFGRAVPGGEPVIATAAESLELADQDVAPDVDWHLAFERLRDIDARMEDDGAVGA